MMNEQQKQLVKDNIDFAKQIAASTHYTIMNNPELYEESKSVAFEYLCKAAINYKESNNSNFKSYAFKVIRWGLWRFALLEYTRGVKGVDASDFKHFRIASQDCLTYNVESNIDEIELVDFLIDFSKDLNKDEQELFSLIIEGYSFSEISKKMNAPLKTVYYIFSTFKEKIGVINSSK